MCYFVWKCYILRTIDQNLTPDVASYNKNGKEGVAVIEFDSSINPEFIGTDFGDTGYHTVVTVFEPDVERNGILFDYAQELLSNPDNIELKIEKRQPTESAIGKKHPNTSGELPSNNGVRNSDGVVKQKFSLSEADQAYTEDIAPVGGYICFGVCNKFVTRSANGK